jgi:hypothetical protein
MAAKNGLAKKIAAWVKDNPGKTRSEIGTVFGFDHHNGVLGYMTQAKMIFPAGPRFWLRYYPTAWMAAANHERICTEVSAKRRPAQRAQVAAARAVLGKLPPGVKIAPHVKVTIAQTPPPRFAPAPGFVGAISSDYVMRRQGANAA